MKDKKSMITFGDTVKQKSIVGVRFRLNYPKVIY